MKMRLFAVAAMMLSLTAMSALADDTKSYTEGTVMTVAAVRTKPGMFDTYMKYLATTYKSLMEDQKKGGIITDYAVYRVMPRSPHDPDVYLTITYKNMAALDGLDDRVEPMVRKVFPTRDQANKATADRESIREILSTQIVRQLQLK